MKDTGRPTYVYGSWHPGEKLIRHELLTTDVLLKYPTAATVRGPDVDSSVRPDWEMTYRGRRYFGELDTGELTHSQVQRRWRKYEAVNREMSSFLLVVTSSEVRMENLRERAELVGNIALFTTHDRVLADPHGMIWMDVVGNTASI